MQISQIFKNNQDWVAKQLDTDPKFFDNLAAGQAPEILYIGCSDSRVTAEDLMGLKPGEMFVHRNVANMVINTDLNSASVINYAVDHLGVKHIVICGHYGCGGVKAAMGDTDLGILNPYLREVRDVYRLHKDELNGIADDDKRYSRLVELNVQEQCVNIAKTIEVQRAYAAGKITVHGWVFDLASGKLIDLKIDMDAVLKDIKSIYAMSV